MLGDPVLCRQALVVLAAFACAGCGTDGASPPAVAPPPAPSAAEDARRPALPPAARDVLILPATEEFDDPPVSLSGDIAAPEPPASLRVLGAMKMPVLPAPEPLVVPDPEPAPTPEPPVVEANV